VTADDAPDVVIGLGASAGGVEALTSLVRNLPVSLEAAILVVLHVSPAGTSVLSQILDRAGPLPAVEATDGAPLTRGTIYVAPPDRHVFIEDGAVRLSAGPRENGHRPAIDPMFRSVAAYGANGVGVILSGTRDDGTRGLARIKAAGGTALVQDPDEALFKPMITSALANVEVDATLPVAGLARWLADHSRGGSSMTMDDDPRADELVPHDDQHATRYTCPDCGGALWRDDADGVRWFRCSVGHAYSPGSLNEEQSGDVEAALWAAVRLLGDRNTLLGEMASRAEEHGHVRTAATFREQAQDVSHAADTIRGLLESGRAVATPAATEQG
jgi:two-component system, chemotaxis family, protein-glutamate methylesterase/glutaminase